jgi:hypothetical protein
MARLSPALLNGGFAVVPLRRTVVPPAPRLQGSGPVSTPSGASCRGSFRGPRTFSWFYRRPPAAAPPSSSRLSTFGAAVLAAIGPLLATHMATVLACFSGVRCLPSTGHTPAHGDFQSAALGAPGIDCSRRAGSALGHHPLPYPAATSRFTWRPRPHLHLKMSTTKQRPRVVCCLTASR